MAAAGEGPRQVGGGRSRLRAGGGWGRLPSWRRRPSEAGRSVHPGPDPNWRGPALSSRDGRGRGAGSAGWRRRDAGWGWGGLGWGGGRGGGNGCCRSLCTLRTPGELVRCSSPPTSVSAGRARRCGGFDLKKAGAGTVTWSVPCGPDLCRRTDSTGRLASLDQCAKRDWRLGLAAPRCYGVPEERHPHPRPPALNKSSYVEPLFTTRRAVPGRVVGEQPLPSVCFKILKAETTIVYHH